jgi:hypothetical protein
MSQVFISYSRQDIRFVRQLAQNLEETGLNVWWDTSDLLGEDAWARSIHWTFDNVKPSQQTAS